jgi:hypothetical protein
MHHFFKIAICFLVFNFGANLFASASSLSRKSSSNSGMLVTPRTPLRKISSSLGIASQASWQELAADIAVPKKFQCWSESPEKLTIVADFVVDPKTWHVLDAGEPNWHTEIKIKKLNDTEYALEVTNPNVQYFGFVNEPILHCKGRNPYPPTPGKTWRMKTSKLMNHLEDLLYRLNPNAPVYGD